MAQSGFHDLFSRDSTAYARFRPRYPHELFAWLATLPERRRLAWDCATGSGQAAASLTRHFDRVVGTDASPAQLRAATKVPGLAYVACLAEETALASRSVDLITIAQALHWLDYPRFFREIDRIIAPGGVLAVIGYARLRGDAELERVVYEFQDGLLGAYWTPERAVVEAGYAGIPVPIEEVTAPGFAIEAELTRDQLLGYIGTWSAVGRYRKMRGEDPMPVVIQRLSEAWGDPDRVRPISWPLFIRAGRWQGPRNQRVNRDG